MATYGVFGGFNKEKYSLLLHFLITNTFDLLYHKQNYHISGFCSVLSFSKLHCLKRRQDPEEWLQRLRTVVCSAGEQQNPQQALPSGWDAGMAHPVGEGVRSH